MRPSQILSSFVFFLLAVVMPTRADGPQEPEAAEPVWVKPLASQPGAEVELLGTRVIEEVGFLHCNQVLHLGGSRWLVAGATAEYEKQLRLFDAATGESTQLYRFGGHENDIPAFQLLAAPFEVDGKRPIAVLALNNFGGRCCLEQRVDFIAGLLESNGRLQVTRKSVAATSEFWLERYSKRTGKLLPFDNTEFFEESRVFFVRPQGEATPSFVMWRKRCEGNGRPWSDIRAQQSAGPCGQGFDLVTDGFESYSIAASGNEIRAGKPLLKSATPPPSFWRVLPRGTWPEFLVGE